MHISYDADADVLYLRVRDSAPVDAVEEPGGVVISYDKYGEPVSIEFLNAAARKLVSETGLSITLTAGTASAAG